MEIRPQTMVRLKSRKNHPTMIVTEIKVRQVRCNWHEPGNDNWIADWFDVDALEQVLPGD